MAFHFNWHMTQTQSFPLIADSSEDDEDVVAAIAAGLLPGLRVRRQRYSVPRVMVRRNINAAWERIERNFFATNPVYPEHSFRRMYRLSLPLFRRIADAVTSYDDYFQQRINAPTVRTVIHTKRYWPH
ncbi:hypothetical protein BS78_01G135400 [Paspalum vaginatum]|nr:hypothetical protein BS78_01G135400 [Paspalum vaginatum]